jgi:hypothetical protein
MNSRWALKKVIVNGGLWVSSARLRVLPLGNVQRAFGAAAR